MRATDELKKEHEGIGLMLRVLDVLKNEYGQGKAPPREDIDGVLEFLSTFVDRCHHGKEEDFLFPTLEAVGVEQTGGPIGVLLAEHELGRRLVGRLKEAVARYDGGEKTAAVGIQHIIGEYITLLTRHIVKENTVLFPMADAYLDADKDTELYEAFEQLERERIGPGKHDEFHGLLDRLQDTYLG